MNDYRNIDGKKFIMIATFKHKYGAELYAKALRRDGWLIRIIKSDKVKNYYIYRVLYK
jgi:hypothetical protein